VGDVEYHLVRAKDLRFLAADEFHDLEGKALEVQGMLASLVQRLQSPVLARG